MQQWAVMGEYRRRIKKIFDEQDIEIPWPHTKVYFGDVLRQEAAGKEAPPEVARKKKKAKFVPPEEVLPPEEEGEVEG
jgi:small-conductance mechanosensitive channel